MVGVSSHETADEIVYSYCQKYGLTVHIRCTCYF